jgi:hypothetical protein
MANWKMIDLFKSQCVVRDKIARSKPWPSKLWTKTHILSLRLYGLSSSTNDVMLKEIVARNILLVCGLSYTLPVTFYSFFVLSSISIVDFSAIKLAAMDVIVMS